MAEAINYLFGWVGIDLVADHPLGLFLAAAIQCALVLAIVATCAAVYIWMERKVAGRIQDRLGPTRVGGRFGWLQSPADGLKLLCKEDVAPKDADVLLFRLAPYISFAAVFTAFLAVPFSDGWVARNINTAIFFVLAVLGIEIFGVILAGYSSGSKWSLFGAMREAAQVVSYEVPLGLCVVVPVFLCGTMNLVTIANMQRGLFTNWLVFHDPFTFGIFWVYFTCAVASVNRAPFDLAEAESELVAGFHTEYSGMRWSMFFMAEYGSMLLVAILATILFFGGWHGPIPVFDWLGLSYADTELANGTFRFGGFLANLAGFANILIKASLGVTAMVWVRWTLPRLRIDQVMATCLKYCVPLAAICFVGALGWQTGMFGLTESSWPSLNNLFAVQRPGEFRELWVLSAEDDDESVTENASSHRPVGDAQARHHGVEMETSVSTVRIEQIKGFQDHAARDSSRERRCMMLLAAVDWHAVMFWLFALLTCGFALAVLFSANIVRMAFYLVLSLGSSAGLFFLTGAEFVGAMQLMIYVGGTLVLLIFGVMLTAQARFITMQTPAGDWIMSALVGGLLLSVLMAAALNVSDWTHPYPDRADLGLAESKTTTQIGLGLAGVRVDQLDQKDEALRKGMSGYLLPFVIVSVHLLVVLIGAAYMARAKRRTPTQEPGG